MKIIGNDEEVARHCGIDTARLKIVLFMISGAFIGMAGAIVAPRYLYVAPPSAFNPTTSFLVVIMALLGGTRWLWGPLVGVIPFTIVMEFVSANFPNDTSIVIGVVFLVIVYLLPDGVTGRLEQLLARIWRASDRSDAATVKEPA
jgi:branched-chain amino acid transport system permease protein